MKSFETWRTWLIIIVLLLFSALAAVLWLAWSQPDSGGADEGSAFLDLDQALSVDIGLEVEGDTEPVTLELNQYLLGEALVDLPLIGDLDGRQVSPFVLTLILLAISLGALVVVTAPLALVFVGLQRQTEAVKADAAFRAAQAELESREKERLKALEEQQPAGRVPEHERSRWAAFSTSMIIVLFVVVAGLAVADTLFPTEVELWNGRLISPGIPFAIVMGFVTLLVLAFFQRPLSSEESDNQAIPWGTIWVILSGLVFIGIGVGLMVVIRSMGGA